jgi:hypothetical protein
MGSADLEKGYREKDKGGKVWFLLLFPLSLIHVPLS